ncbi:MAG: 30S ribosomal protein S20 [Oscillospiraceae bacterium]|nr:30S ribosomal protein S20 [Oscillospiraceae bacterium]MBQ8378580.1 30S ribosomal protein S20 [Oscillospiraceae bacterium]MBQ8883427.1 30S ribosomal protein S20 [Oscillospiraceae bacterium]
MPNIKSAKKRVKVIETKTLRNKAIKSDLKTAIKKANAAVEANENVDVAVTAAIKKVDKACAKGVMHKNKAARKKSQLAKLANAAK